MKQNEINAVRAARGLGNLTGAAEMQADAQIRLELLFERAGDSMGAFERATNTLYGSQQLLNAALQNLMVSAGAPLQEPLAQINNLFAALVSEAGPELTEVFDAIGGAIDTVAPTIEKLARGALNLVEMLEQVVEVIDLVLTPVLNGLNVALDIVNPALELLGTILDGISAIFENINLHLRRFGELLKSTPLAPFIEGLEWLSENGFGIGAAFKFLNDQIEKQNQLLQATNGNFIETSSGAREASSAMRKAGTAARETQEDLENMAAANKAWTDSWTARAVKFAEDNGIALNEIFKKNIVTGAAQTGTDYVSDFFQGIEDSVKKEAARIKLAAMGASEGLIEAILGAGGWEQVYNRVIKGGIEGLKDLQREFNQTAAGIQELTDAIKEAEKAQQALRDAAQKAIDDNIARLEAEFKKAEAYFVQVQQKAEEFKRWSLDNISNIQILPDFETQLGKFESAIVSTIQGIQNQLISAVRSGLIFEDDFANLQRWVDTESVALMEIARRRDELANRYSLSESLIREYQTALTSALSLTGLFGRLKDETETKTVSEVTSGVVKLSGSLKEFNLTVTRSYEETIQKVIDKSEGLVQGFRDIAQKARDFAENLRKLRDMGLDPMLFNQLVSAGVEAGGETAQALVDGGSETVNEINSIFDEINQLGAELGMDVGQTMYDAGKDITYGLLDGIKSEQEQLYELATEMARTFSETFKNNFSVAIDQPVKAAESAANTAKAALDQAKDANVDALVQINELIAGAEKALSGKLSSAFRAGVEGKLGAFEAVRQDIISGQVTDIGGLTRGLTSAKAEELLKGTGGTTVNNYYNVEVKADTRTQGAKAGEALVNQINKFEQTSGTTDVSRLLAV
jgi:hypothetical protein